MALGVTHPVTQPEPPWLSPLLRHWAFHYLLQCLGGKADWLILDLPKKTYTRIARYSVHNIYIYTSLYIYLYTYYGGIAEYTYERRRKPGSDLVLL